MSITTLKVGLQGRIGKGLLPSFWPTESLMSWCREVAKHNDDVLDQEENDELFNLINSLIELLLFDDAERLAYFRKSRASLFEVLACELDDIIRSELISRIIGYDMHRGMRCDLFYEHFPMKLGEKSGKAES